jgi:hypothetical protein
VSNSLINLKSAFIRDRQSVIQGSRVHIAPHTRVQTASNEIFCRP